MTASRQPLAGALGFFLCLLKLLKREHLLADQQLSNPAHSAVSPKKTMSFKAYRVTVGSVKRPSLGALSPPTHV